MKILRIVWFKKVTKSKKIYLLLIMKTIIDTMMNQLMNMSMLNIYYKCECKLFLKNCCIMQCFKCHKFNYMIKFCKKNQCCIKCTDKHYIKKCMTCLNNCNENHKLWRYICLKWEQQMKQAFEIYRNILFRYSETFKYKCILLQFLNSLLFSNLTNLKTLSSMTIMLKTCSLITQELT